MLVCTVEIQRITPIARCPCGACYGPGITVAACVARFATAAVIKRPVAYKPQIARRFAYGSS